jgi:hypothetical protein
MVQTLFLVKIYEQLVQLQMKKITLYQGLKLEKLL